MAIIHIMGKLLAFGFHGIGLQSEYTASGDVCIPYNPVAALKIFIVFSSVF